MAAAGQGVHYLFPKCPNSKQMQSLAEKAKLHDGTLWLHAAWDEENMCRKKIRGLSFRRCVPFPLSFYLCFSHTRGLFISACLPPFLNIGREGGKEGNMEKSEGRRGGEGGNGLPSPSQVPCRQWERMPTDVFIPNYFSLDADRIFKRVLTRVPGRF